MQHIHISPYIILSHYVHTEGKQELFNFCDKFIIAKVTEPSSLVLSWFEEREDLNSELKDSYSVFSHVLILWPQEEVLLLRI